MTRWTNLTMPKVTVPKGYRAILLDARQKRTRKGKRVTWSQAKYFHLCYHTRQIAEFLAFTGRRRTIAAKQAYFFSLVKAMERIRQQELATRRKKDRDRRYKEKLEGVLKRERIDVKSLRFEASKTGKDKRVSLYPSSVIGPVAIVPILTKATDYTKDIVEKKLRSKMWSQYTKIQILDFTLKTPVTVTQENLKSVMKDIEFLFKPHIDKYFKQTRGTPRSFWFRLKFNYPMLDKKNKMIVRNSGVSLPRFQVNEIGFFPTRILEHVPERLAGERFWAKIDRTYNKSANYILENNYFDRSATKELQIIGFTLENVIELGKRFDPKKIKALYLAKRKKRIAASARRRRK